MRKKISFWINPVLAALLLFGIAAAAILPAAAIPGTDKVIQSADVSVAFDGTFDVIVQGECVSDPGRYTLKYGSVYNDLFELAGVTEQHAYDPYEKIRMEDVVLIGGEYVLFLVL